MAIEFRCIECGKLLRVADETAGKQAKCPACGAVAPIPSQASPFAALPSASQTGPIPFASVAPTVQTMPSGSGGEFNPYQAPSTGAEHYVSGYQPFGDGFDNASPGARLGAVLLDVLLYAFVLIVCGICAGILGAVINNGNNEADALLVLIVWGGLFVAVLVQWVLVSQRGQTVGKIALGIRIVDFQTGANPGFVKAVILRSWVPTFIRFIPCLGHIFILADPLWIFGEESRCLHDLIAETRVVNVRQ